MSENNTSVTSEHDVDAAAAKARPGGVMLTVYRWTLLVFLAAGVVQIFLAGLGAFKLLHGARRPGAGSAPDAGLRDGRGGDHHPDPAR